MRLTDEFQIATSPDEAFALLLDLPRVAPCVPGAEIGAPEADGSYAGRVSVKLGPMKFVYDGRVRFADRDDAARTATILGEGKASGGADTARLTAHMEVLPAGEGSLVKVATDLEIKGRAAQMGQGVIADVSKRLVRDTVRCIEAKLANPDATDIGSSAPVGGIGLMASVMGAKVGDSVRRLGGRGKNED
jgi:uncharacterized protein